VFLESTLRKKSGSFWMRGKLENPCFGIFSTDGTFEMTPNFTPNLERVAPLRNKNTGPFRLKRIGYSIRLFRGKKS